MHVALPLMHEETCIISIIDDYIRSLCVALNVFFLLEEDRAPRIKTIPTQCSEALIPSLQDTLIRNLDKGGIIPSMSQNFRQV